MWTTKLLGALFLTVNCLSGGCDPGSLDTEHNTSTLEGTDDEVEFAVSATAATECDLKSSLLVNGNFSADLASWTTEIHEPASATISAVLDGATNKVVRVRNSKVQDFYKVQFWQPVTSIEKDHCYRVCFRAKASADREIQVQLIKNAAPWGSYGLWWPQAITSKWTTYKTEFWANSTASDGRLAFAFGANTSAAYIDNVVLIDRGDVDDCKIP